MGGAQRQIEWSTASVEDAALTVSLSGEAPRGWRKRFEAVATLLDRSDGRFGRVSVRGPIVTVADVLEGAEADVRHFLESAVMQVNADLGLEEAPEEDAGEEADRAMAATFRSFAEPTR
ncbi:MAG TPA: hypothetical protein VHX66_04510 [Solirubrobacteraceae bacterium]|jgi:hypothetical protein|nr:hypothetical protein [Solirubrobacteraceae bacterium]